MRDFTIAICQNSPGYDIDRNVERALRMVEKAARRGARVVVLPEMFYFPYDMERLASIAGDNGRMIDRFREAAANFEVYVLAGTIAEKSGGLITNTAHLIDSQGEVIHSYSKSHLFDVDLPHLRVQESSVFAPGNRIDVIRTDDAVFGVLVCYDIRFPEAARTLALAGAEVLLVPAAFNTITGPAHWHVTFRSRAIENQVYVVAASPARNNRLPYRAFGHSLVVDPWGCVLAEAGTGESIVFASIGNAALENARNRLPLLKHRRNELYKL